MYVTVTAGCVCVCVWGGLLILSITHTFVVGHNSFGIIKPQ